jgi:hypothetical protein
MKRSVILTGKKISKAAMMTISTKKPSIIAMLMVNAVKMQLKHRRAKPILIPDLASSKTAHHVNICYDEKNECIKSDDLLTP